jgi:hypothetical protein
MNKAGAITTERYCAILAQEQPDGWACTGRPLFYRRLSYDPPASTNRERRVGEFIRKRVGKPCNDRVIDLLGGINLSVLL